MFDGVSLLNDFGTLMSMKSTKQQVESCLTIGPPRGPLRDIVRMVLGSIWMVC